MFGVWYDFRAWYKTDFNRTSVRVSLLGMNALLAFFVLWTLTLWEKKTSSLTKMQFIEQVKTYCCARISYFYEVGMYLSKCNKKDSRETKIFQEIIGTSPCIFCFINFIDDFPQMAIIFHFHCLLFIIQDTKHIEGTIQLQISNYQCTKLKNF